MRFNTFAGCLMLSAVLCTGFGTVTAETVSPKAAETQAAIDAAEVARKKAAAVEGEWRDTGKMIKKAQSALKSGEFDKALKLANEAKAQGELGHDQAVSQKSASMKSYIRY